MAEEAAGDRPHEATPKRIEDALKRGDTPASREPALAGGLVAFAALAAGAGGDAMATLSASLVPLWRDAAALDLADAEGSVALLRGIGAAAGLAIAVPLAGIAAGALLPSLAQRPRVAAQRIAPKGSNLSIAKGVKRVFGPGGLFEFAKSILKIVVIGGAAGWMAWGGVAETMVLPHGPDAVVAVAMGERVARLSLLVASMAVPVALADLLWSRRRWRTRLRMSHDELKRETKDGDGDPAVKARRHSLRRDRARRGMIARTDEAHLVVVNPTHVAVALRYDRGRNAAPVVVAKGRGHVALRIRERAAASAIPLFEEPPLARALERAVPVDATIPEEFYALVARLVRLLDGA